MGVPRRRHQQRIGFKLCEGLKHEFFLAGMPPAPNCSRSCSLTSRSALRSSANFKPPVTMTASSAAPAVADSV